MVDDEMLHDHDNHVSVCSVCNKVVLNTTYCKSLHIRTHDNAIAVNCPAKSIYEFKKSRLLYCAACSMVLRSLKEVNQHLSVQKHLLNRQIEDSSNSNEGAKKFLLAKVSNWPCIEVNEGLNYFCKLCEIELPKRIHVIRHHVLQSKMHGEMIPNEHIFGSQMNMVKPNICSFGICL